MTTDKPRVLILRIKGNPESERDAFHSKRSWQEQGFCVDFFDAVTPDDLEDHDYLDFGRETLRTGKKVRHKTPFLSTGGILKTDESYYPPFKENDNFYLRKISTTEKAVYYSHVEIWKYISATKIPHIVVEDDCTLLEKIPENFDWSKWYFYGFSNCLLWSYYCHPKMTDYLLGFIRKYNLGLGDKWPKGFQSGYYVHRPLLLNVDGFLMSVLTHLSYQTKNDDKFYDKLNYCDPFFHDWFRDSTAKERNLLAGNYIARKKIIQHKEEGVGCRFIDHRNYQKIENKVAVMINGLIPTYLNRDHVRDSIQRLWVEFQGCDIYYQTWDTPEQRKFVSQTIGNRVNVEFVKPPSGCSYDSFGLVKEDIDEKYWSYLKRFKNISKKRITDSSCNQQLSFWEQWKHIPKGYDYYVRTRWDIYFNDNLPLEELYALAEDNVIGIGSPTKTTNRNLRVIWDRLGEKPEEESEEWPEWFEWYCGKVKEKRHKYKAHIDSPFYCIIDEDTLDRHGNQWSLPVWNHFLSDMMIIFKESDMEGIDVSKMYEQEKLYPCEFGWHQILCNKRQHKNIDALVGIKRNILSDKNFIQNCRHLGF